MTDEKDILAHFVERSFRAALHPCVYPYIQHHPALESLRRDMRDSTWARHGALAETLAEYRWKIHIPRSGDQDQGWVLSRALLDEARAGQDLLGRDLFKASIWISSIGPDREAMALFAATMECHPAGIYNYIDALAPFMDRVPKTAILQVAAMRRRQLQERMARETLQSGDPLLRIPLRGQWMDVAHVGGAPDFWTILYRMTRAYWSARFAGNPETLRDGIPFQDAAWLLHSAARFAATPAGSAQGESGGPYRYIVESLARERVAHSRPANAH